MEKKITALCAAFAIFSLMAFSGSTQADGRMETVGAEALRQAREIRAAPEESAPRIEIAPLHERLEPRKPLPVMERGNDDSELAQAIREDSAVLDGEFSGNGRLAEMIGRTKGFHDGGIANSKRESRARRGGTRGDGETAVIGERPSLSEAAVFPSLRRGK